MKGSERGFPVISFDGMHRSGKGTQIQLLKNFCLEQEIRPYILRGEYYRFGTGSNPIEDPYSERRQKNKFAKCYDLKSQRLNRELHVTLERIIPKLQQQGQQDVVAILDRSIVGRVLMNNTKSKYIAQKENPLIYQYGSSAQYSRSVIIPDCMFVLQCSQAKLLERLFASEELDLSYAELLLSDKYEMIKNEYDSYYQGLELIPDLLQDRLHIIDGDQSPQDIHEHIVETLQTKGLLRLQLSGNISL